MLRVFIDPGHGGKDPGACNGNFKEKDINLDVALILGEILNKEGFEVAYSRTTDVSVSLGERVFKSNRFRADVFLSIHCNAFTDTQAQGVETFYYKTSGKGKQLAAKIQANIVNKGIYSRDRGIKPGSFYVLKKTRAVAALVELGFITNRVDLEIMLRNKEEFAKVIAESIKEYLSGK